MISIVESSSLVCSRRGKATFRWGKPEVFVLSSLVTCEKKQNCKEQIDNDNQKYGLNHGLCGGPADLLRACASRQPLKTTDGGDGDAKHHALHQSRRDIPQKQGVDRSLDVAQTSEIRLRDAEQ